MSKKRQMQRKSGGGVSSNGRVVEVKNKNHFDNLLRNTDKPVVIDFWAPWCGPCKAMAPVFSAAADAHRDEARFLKINTEANPTLARAFNINSIPTLVVMVDGEVVDARVGLTGRGELDKLIKRAADKRSGVGLFGKVKRLFGSEEANASA